MEYFNILSQGYLNMYHLTKNVGRNIRRLNATNYGKNSNTCLLETFDF